MGRITVTVPYVRQTASGFYWEPSRKLKLLGFHAESLGKDRAKAEARAIILNRQASAAQQDKAAPAAPVEGTVAWTIAEYQRSQEWLKLADNTKRGYRQCLVEIEKWAGEEGVSTITRKAAKQWQRAIEARAPAFAAAIIRVLRVVLHFAKGEGYEVADLGKMKLHTAGGNSEPWEDHEISAYLDEARHGGRQSMALAMMLGVCLGQREGDIIKMAWNQLVAGEIVLTQHKTGKTLAVPALPELVAEMKRTAVKSPTMVISEATGRPYKVDNFRHVHRDICRAAGIPDKRQFMHLRHTAATRLGEAGCADDLIRAVTGHKDRGTVGRYVKPNSTMARAAIATLIRNRNGTATEK
jgi:integrase